MSDDTQLVVKAKLCVEAERKKPVCVGSDRNRSTRAGRYNGTAIQTAISVIAGCRKKTVDRAHTPRCSSAWDGRWIVRKVVIDGAIPS
ncbi:hypothetical protein TNCV_3006431 [Trichonephila clavipes]|nr:hypothetical protein TNCV_3006431 [Trichonephila clavipes]